MTGEEIDRLSGRELDFAVMEAMGYRVVKTDSGRYTLANPVGDHFTDMYFIKPETARNSHHSLKDDTTVLCAFRWLRAFVADRSTHQLFSDHFSVRVCLQTNNLQMPEEYREGHWNEQERFDYTCRLIGADGECESGIKEMCASGGNEGEAIGRALLKIVAALKPPETPAQRQGLSLP